MPFTKSNENLIETLALNAAITLENAKLGRDIKNLFESFITASVGAIEARDPITKGHSERVAAMTVRFAQNVDQSSNKEFESVSFNKEQIQEIRYAGLLHDFGKIGIREELLTKGKKLYNHEMKALMLRLDNLQLQNEVNLWKELAQNFAHGIIKPDLLNPQNPLNDTVKSFEVFNREMTRIRDCVKSANEPQILSTDVDINALISWLAKLSTKFNTQILTEHEIERLSIPRGTLTKDERIEIESHVKYTYEFLSQIAWSSSFSKVPDIAHAHHEKLNGSGYPRGITAEKIPLQSQMMTICDIYDALTSLDRPYKSSVNAERALDILYLEASEGKINKNLLDIFVEARVFTASLFHRASDISVKQKVG